MIERSEFHASPFCGLIPLLGGTPFLLLGVFGLAIVGWESWYFFGGFAAFGGLVFMIGCELPFERLVVDGEGIVEVHWFGLVRSRTSWEDIERWWAGPYSVTPELAGKIWAGLYPEHNLMFGRPVLLDEDGPSSFFRHAILARVRGRRWPLFIHDYQSWAPGLSDLIAMVRHHLGDKELVVTETVLKAFGKEKQK